MDPSKEPQQSKQGMQSIKQTGLEMAVQAEALLERIKEEQAEQTALLEATPLESQYSAAFGALVRAKHNQAEHIEDKLENLIEQQASRLQRMQSQQPGMLTLPGTRSKWQQQIQQQTRSMQRLHGRLETVREIKEGMGINGPRIEELATRKLRAQDPALVSDWDGLREAQRQHQALLRKQEQEKKQAFAHEQQNQPGRGMRLGLSPAQ